MKPLMVAALILFAAPQTKAGDFDFSFGFAHQRKGLRVGVGVHKQGPGKDLRVGVDVRKRGPGKDLRVGVGVQRTGPRTGAFRKHRHRDCCIWVPAHYENVRRRVWIRGHFETFRGRACGSGHHRKARPHARQRCGFPPRHSRGRRLAHHRHWVPGHYEWRVERVYHPGSWECRHRHH